MTVVADIYKLPTRFQRYVVPMQDGCWDYFGRISGAGYGLFYDKVLDERWVHRLTYRTLVGEIPKGLDLDHLCRNRACVNPDHLEPVTRQENALRGLRANKTHCRHGHEFTPENTYINQTTGHRSCQVCRRLLTAKRNRARSLRTKGLAA